MKRKMTGPPEEIDAPVDRDWLKRMLGEPLPTPGTLTQGTVYRVTTRRGTDQQELTFVDYAPDFFCGKTATGKLKLIRERLIEEVEELDGFTAPGTP